MTHDELVEVGKKWLAKPWRRRGCDGHGSCSVIIAEMTSASWETPDVIGWHSGFTTLIECKTSRSDFRADRKKYFRANPEMGMGSQRYFLTPTGLILPEELPTDWGLIEAGPNGKTRVFVPSGRFQSHKGQEVDMLLSLLCRLKVDPGRHVNIRTYSMDTGKEPRATAAIALDGKADDPDPLRLGYEHAPGVVDAALLLWDESQEEK